MESKMKLELAVMLMLVTIGCSVQPISAPPAPNDLRKAFLDHQKYEFAGVKAYYPQLGGESFVLSERWKNYQKYAKECPAIAEVVTVEISQTSDGGEFVIQMKGPSAHRGKDGFESDVCSLWVSGGELNVDLPVRDFTSY